jgi:class 3 adenylate cyclase
MSEATFKVLRTDVPATALGAQRVKGRDAPVYAYKIMGGR